MLCLGGGTRAAPVYSGTALNDINLWFSAVTDERKLLFYRAGRLRHPVANIATMRNIAPMPELVPVAV